MPSLTGESSASPDNLAAARRIQRATKRAVAEIRRSRRRLLRAVRRVPRGQPPVVDGKPALVEGDPVDLVEWLRSRIEGTCLDGALSDAIEDLEYETTADPLEALARYVRESR